MRNIALVCVATAGFGAGPAMSHALDDRAGAVEKPAATAPPPQFRTAAHVPGDVTLYLHIEDAAAIRREVAGRPIAAWFNETLAAGEAGRVWSQVAKAADLDEAALFDAMLGRRVTFVVRKRSVEEPGHHAKNDGQAVTAEWALLTEVTVDAAEKALAALEPVALGPRSRMAMLELPEHELLLARRGDLLLIGPRENRGLFRQVLRAIGGREVDDAEMLAAKMTPQALKRAGHAAAGPSVALFLQHEAPLGGCSIAVAKFTARRSEAGGQNQVVGDQAPDRGVGPLAADPWPQTPFPDLVIRHYGSFDAPPFTRGVTRGAVDCSILDAFESEPLLAMVEPNDAGRSKLELFLHAIVGEGLISPKMRANFGERRIVVLGEVSGAPPVDALHQTTEPATTPPPSSPIPTLAVCYELKRAEDAEELLDRQMLAFSRRLNQKSEVRSQKSEVGDQKSDDRFEALSSDLCPLAPSKVQGRPRSVEVPAAANILGGVSLNWTHVADGPHGGGGWYVIASHPDQLDEIVSMLSRPAFVSQKPEVKGQKSGGRIKGQAADGCSLTSVPSRGLHSAGVAQGPRLAHLLLNLRDAAALFSGDQEQQAEMRESIRVLADLAAGLEHVRWRLVRPSANEIDVEVRIRLAE